MPTAEPDTELIVLVVLESLMGGVLIVFSILCIIRRCQSHHRTVESHTYNAINHGLDEEEIEFKNMIEQKGFEFGDTDDDSYIFEDSKEDLTFDSKDKSRLNMLEKLRSNLVSSASKGHKLGSDDEASDNERIRL
jgi:hypothetical protein